MIDVNAVALPNLTDVVDRFTTPDKSVPGLLIELWLTQQQHGSLDIVEPNIRIEAALPGKSSSIPHVSRSGVVCRKTEPQPFAQR